jgi:hypothetical protein
MTTLLATEPVTTTDVLNVLVCHDSRAAEQRARDMLARLLTRLEDGIDFEVRAWNCEDLDWDNIPARARAHADALAATFCLVAWTGKSRPTPSLRRLVEEWTQCHRATPAVLAVLHAGEGPNRHLVEELRRAADRAGVDILPSGEGDTTFLSLHEKQTPGRPASRIPITWDSEPSTFQPDCRLRP